MLGFYLNYDISNFVLFSPFIIIRMHTTSVVVLFLCLVSIFCSVGAVYMYVRFHIFT